MDGPFAGKHSRIKVRQCEEFLRKKRSSLWLTLLLVFYI